MLFALIVFQRLFYFPYDYVAHWWQNAVKKLQINPFRWLLDAVYPAFFILHAEDCGAIVRLGNETKDDQRITVVSKPRESIVFKHDFPFDASRESYEVTFLLGLGIKKKISQAKINGRVLYF